MKSFLKPSVKIRIMFSELSKYLLSPREIPDGQPMSINSWLTSALKEDSSESDVPPHSQGSDHPESDNKATPSTVNYI